MVISTMLPPPPLSNLLFQLTPKSWRLIVVLAVKPALSFRSLVHSVFPWSLPPPRDTQIDVLGLFQGIDRTHAKGWTGLKSAIRFFAPTTHYAQNPTKLETRNKRNDLNAIVAAIKISAADFCFDRNRSRSRIDDL